MTSVHTAAEPVRPDAAYAALLRLESYVNERSAALRGGWIFGPNLDDCYFYRMRYNDSFEYLTDGGNSPQKQFALSRGIPNLDSIPSGERQALYIANYEGRRSAVNDSGQFLCVKHIPGGTRFLENTEHIRAPVVYPDSLEQWQPSLQPFVSILKGPRPVPALMTSHACYPGLEADMRGAYPEIQSWMPATMDCPATFSPWIIQGLVKKHLGYAGPIVTDWIDMGAINRFLLDYRKTMPARYVRLSNEALIVVLALEAGCHFVTGIQNRLLRIARPINVAPLVDELAGYGATDASWERTLDARLREALTWFARPPFSQVAVSVDSAMAMPTQDKIRLVLGERVDHPDAQWTNKLSTKGFQDLWNRQGLLHSQLRAFYIAERFQIMVPDLPYKSDDERVVSSNANVDWIESVMRDPRYAGAYRNIAWEAASSSQAWDDALQRFLRERGYTGP